MKVFLSYTSDDIELARRIAETFMDAGIDTWWDKWCIYPGDSLRQKIDEGLSDCTHFLVLLTPQSLNKPWVNAEMDAALVQKLDNQCKFLPVRHDLPVSALPPLLKGLFSPTVTTDEEIKQLINDIYGVSRKPPLGAPPEAVAEARQTDTGYSPAATTVARLFVERSKHGLFGDPQFTVGELVQETDLSIEDTQDAIDELSDFVGMSSKRGEISQKYVFAKKTCFAKFDRYWKPWNPVEDARQLAADLVNDPEFPPAPGEVAERYDWKPRRLCVGIPITGLSPWSTGISSGMGCIPCAWSWTELRSACQSLRSRPLGRSFYGARPVRIPCSIFPGPVPRPLLNGSKARRTLWLLGRSSGGGRERIQARVERWAQEAKEPTQKRMNKRRRYQDLVGT